MIQSNSYNLRLQQLNCKADLVILIIYCRRMIVMSRNEFWVRRRSYCHANANQEKRKIKK